MSTMGTLSSLAGGTLMGVTMALTLLWQNTACQAQWTSVLFPLVLWGTLAGGLGSLVSLSCISLC